MLIAESLTKVYQSGDRTLTVLDQVSLDVTNGEFVAIVGPSGSGKTTLLGLLAGLDTPTNGRVILDNTNISAMTEDERARVRGQKVGFVFQNFQLIPTLTAIENVQVPLELRGSVGRKRRNTSDLDEFGCKIEESDTDLTLQRPDELPSERARNLLTQVGLGQRFDHFPTQLSGGEQQRVAIARAFANYPSILFADEPTGNLDAHTGARVIELLESFNREAGTTIILVTHDLDLAAHATRTIRIADGAIIHDSAIHTNVATPTHESMESAESTEPTR